MTSQNKTSQKPKKRTVLIVVLSIFAGLLIFLALATSIGYFVLKYYTSKTTQVLSNIQGWEQVLDEVEEEDPIIAPPKLLGNQEINPRKNGQIHEPISNENIEIIVDSIEAIEIPNVEPYENHQFYKINFTIKNTTSSDQPVYLYNFTLQDRKEEFAQFIFEDDWANRTNDIDPLSANMTLIPANELVKGDIIFEVKKNHKNLEFIYDDYENTILIIKLDE